MYKKRPIDRPVADCADPNLEIVTTDDGSKTLRCKKHCITWHSESGALSECEWVYLRNSLILECLAPDRPVSVLEIGFGTGLNFFLTANAVINRNRRLNYIAIEPELLPFDVFEQLDYGQLPDCQTAFDRFSQEIFANRLLQIERQGVDLQIVTDIADLPQDVGDFDGIYHDPFAPDVASELWSERYLERLFSLLKPEKRLVTYCVKSAIQRRLAAIGFEVSKTPGPVGGKREVLIAVKRGKIT